MKRVMTFAMALMAACACAEIKAVATDVGDVPMTAEDDVSSRFRIAGGAVGRFGVEGRLQALVDVGGKKAHTELYGIGLDVQYKLLEKDGFNLWLGLGGRYLPEQDVAKGWDCILDVPSVMKIDFARKVEMKAYDLRVMLIPEWELTSSFALGARVGLGCTHYRGKETFRFDYEMTDNQTNPPTTTTGSISLAASFSETELQGILGLQATWMVSDRIGLYAYGDGIFGGDVEITEDCTVDGFAVEAGIGLTISF